MRALCSNHYANRTMRLLKLQSETKSPVTAYCGNPFNLLGQRCQHTVRKSTSIFSSADPKVSSAELMVLLICPSSVVVRRRPSVNFCFKSLLLLQFLFDHSDFFTGETRHIVPPCNKAGISNFCLELQKLQKFQIS